MNTGKRGEGGGGGGTGGGGGGGGGAMTQRQLRKVEHEMTRAKTAFQKRRA